MGLTAPELCPAGPSRRSAFTRKLQGKRQGLKPRHIQHEIQDAKGDGKGSSARSAQPRRLTGAWRHNFMAEYAFEK
jgi:hypothetical protein